MKTMFLLHRGGFHITIQFDITLTHVFKFDSYKLGWIRCLYGNASIIYIWIF